MIVSKGKHPLLWPYFKSVDSSLWNWPSSRAANRFAEFPAWEDFWIRSDGWSLSWSALVLADWELRRHPKLLGRDQNLPWLEVSEVVVPPKLKQSSSNYWKPWFGGCLGVGNLDIAHDYFNAYYDYYVHIHFNVYIQIYAYTCTYTSEYLYLYSISRSISTSIYSKEV